MAYWVADVRERFRGFWEARLPPYAASLLIGLTIGGKGILPPELKEDCIRAGVYHLVVVSGQNLAILVIAGLWCFERLWMPRRYLLFWTGLPLLFFMQVAGADPPILRAGLMTLYALSAAALRRDGPALYPLWFSAGFLLLLWPEALFGASFQLSFVATAALLFFLPYIERVWSPENRLLAWAWQTLAVTIMINICLGPLLAFYFQRYSLSGFVAPWIIYPLAGIMMVGGLGVGIWGILSPQTVPAAVVLLFRWSMEAILWLIHELASWPAAVVRVPALHWIPLGLWYLGLFGILWAFHRRLTYDSFLAFHVRRRRL
jgi:competence protein ComEC